MSEKTALEEKLQSYEHLCHSLDEMTEMAVLAEEGREVVFVASICGTYEDVQDYSAQKSLLEGQGVVVLESNAQAAQLAILTVSK